MCDYELIRHYKFLAFYYCSYRHTASELFCGDHSGCLPLYLQSTCKMATFFQQNNTNNKRLEFRSFYTRQCSGIICRVSTATIMRYSFQGVILWLTFEGSFPFQATGVCTCMGFRSDLGTAYCSHLVSIICPQITDLFEFLSFSVQNKC